LFAGDPFYLGVCGTFATSLGGDVFTQADPVLVFGATLNPFTTYANDLFRRTRIIQFDSDPAAFGRFIDVEPEFAILADARLAAEALVAELERRGTQSTGIRSGELRERIASFDPRVDFRDESLADLIDPRTLMLALHRILPVERTVVVDPGHHMVFSARYLGVTRPQDFVLPIEAGAIGVGMGPAIGATFARPGTPCVLGEGDGGFMMALADLETAVRYSCPLVVVVSNDMALGAEVVFLESIGQPTDLARHSTPSFAAVAQALGAEGYTVRTVDDLGPLAERFQRPLRGPVVLDCYVNPQVHFDAGAKLRAVVQGRGENEAAPVQPAVVGR
jgi:thiamine pyrophosphate-dependent acetolactate synthase large subunit-like protein